jgi:hypothetical protein
MDLATKFKTPFVTILIMVLFTGCEKVCDCVKSTGELASEFRSVSDFNEIEFENNIDLIIHIDTIPKIKVTAGKNLITEITTENNEGVLRIKNKNDCNWIRDYDRKIIVEVWTKSINHILATSVTGDIYFEDSLECDVFNFDSYSSTGIFNFKFKGNEAHLNIHSGPADINAIGQLNNIYLYGTSYGKFDCLNLISNNVIAQNRGTNNFYVTSRIFIEAIIYGSGNIYFSGNPREINRQEFGQGKLISL